MSVYLGKVKVKKGFESTPTQTTVSGGPIKIVKFRNTEIPKMVL